MFSRPAFTTALCLTAGLWISYYIHANTLEAASVCVFVSGIVVGRYVFTRHCDSVLVAIAITAAGFALGAATIPSLELNSQNIARFEDRTQHVLYVSCLEDPVEYNDGCSFRAEIYAVHEHGVHPFSHTNAIVRLTLTHNDTIHPIIRAGDHLLLSGKIRAIEGIQNPGDFNYAEYFRVQSISARISVFGASNIEYIGKEVNPSMFTVLQSKMNALRRSIAAKFDEYIGGEEGDFMKGLLLGERSELPEDVHNAFINTGTFHILTVAGLHIGFMLLILIGVLSPITNRTAHWLFLCGALAGYAMLAGLAPSVQRAALMAGLAVTGRFFERKVDGINIVGSAACILLVANPPLLFTAGFQLSFAAAFGLVLLYPRLWNLASQIPISRWKGCRWALELFCASFAALISTLPLTALYFEKVSLAGIIVSLIVVPAAGIAIGLSSFIAVISPIPWLGYLLGDFSRVYVHILLRIVEWFGTIPHSYANIPPFSFAQALLFYAATVFLIFSRDWKTLGKRTSIAILSFLAYAAFPYSVSNPIFAPHALTIAALDVGQGDGIVIRLPNGKTIVVDAGPANMREQRNLAVTAFLRRQGISHIDGLFLTHLHADHIGGAPELLREFDIDTIYHSGERTFSAAADLLDSIVVAQHIPVKRVATGNLINCDSLVRMYVLYPDSIAVSENGKTIGGNLNNGSIAMKFQYGATSAILSGDVEKIGEQELSSRYGDFLRANILKAGHHGSATSSTPDYLSCILPKSAIISVGENNFGHPSPDVLTRFQADTIDIERTDEEGAVIWQSDGEKWSRVLWRQH